MKLPSRPLLVLLLGLTLLVIGVIGAAAAPTTPPSQDPLVRMPGTQPNELSLTPANACITCHADYDPAVEPGFNWEGSMKAQAARDPLYWASMAVAAQDSIWAIGSPNATDLCLRCHMPKGWLEGRSENPNASAMVSNDYDGVQCDFCHRMWDPHFEDTYSGLREGDDWAGYWDEAGNSGPGSGTLAQTSADNARAADITAAEAISFMNGQPFFDANGQPVSPAYTEASSGQYFVSPRGFRRASFSDAAMFHGIEYSRFHKSKFFCATCHDVSNPVLANLNADPNQPLPSETQSSSVYFPLERTFSEFILSDYGQQGGAAGLGPFAPDVFDTSRPGNVIAACQDCHMADQPGRGAAFPEALLRTGDPATSESTEHPYSGQPVHDLTGGNMWVPTLLASTVPSSPNYDPVNAALLGQGAAALTLDLDYGLGLNAEALLAGAQRAQSKLQRAAAIEQLSFDPLSGALSFRIQNQTGHKLISGYPEGRRMFVGIKVYGPDTSLIYEINPYDAAVGTLKGLGVAGSPPLGPGQAHLDALVYEAKNGSSLTGEQQTQHFVLSDQRYKDNRIPPLGFDIAAAPSRQTEPVWQGTIDPGYFSAAEYAGGYDAITVTLPITAAIVDVSLYYQTTSREYVAFLRREINGEAPLTLPDPNPVTRPNEAYIVQSDPFFSQLKAWGDTMWQLWLHNKDLPGAAPVLMTRNATAVAPFCHPADVHPNAASGNPEACDGDVDVADVQRVAGCWLQSVGAACPARLDFNDSGVIDLSDIVFAAENWNWHY
ncbi:MAG TPA: multiheme c-type cytochrome [Anaerolineae bacterium]|nr:multiheme c-type cytochrome [Anaerolineae bacterium]HNU05698.1 multiheme c-type cytochrome [Anaerolineae bacterium]